MEIKIEFKCHDCGKKCKYDLNICMKDQSTDNHCVKCKDKHDKNSIEDFINFMIKK